MKTLLLTVLLILAVSLTSDAVNVQEGQFSFQLESVKRLLALMAKDAPATQSNRRAAISAVAVCDNPDLPEEFQPLCRSKNARASFSRLARLASRIGVCEICAYAACTGC
ncbi:guanylin-like [Salminus brasiliensis]|uniref:guanylin-like n=1 Tax=Salminus brasiliensis TaxID=930266 RepID=UPI003B82FD29